MPFLLCHEEWICQILYLGTKHGYIQEITIWTGLYYFQTPPSSIHHPLIYESLGTAHFPQRSEVVTAVWSTFTEHTSQEIWKLCHEIN